METSATADVEKLQDVIRQLEVQNEKLRSRGSRQNTPNTKGKMASIQDPPEDILLLPILADEEMRQNLSEDNFVSCLSKEDYESSFSLFGENGVLRQYTIDEIPGYEELEIAKRYNRRLGERMNKREIEQQKAQFEGFEEVKPYIVDDEEDYFSKRAHRVRENTMADDYVASNHVRTDNNEPLNHTITKNLRSRSPIALPRPSQSRLHEERERGRSISPSRRSPSPFRRRYDSGGSPTRPVSPPRQIPASRPTRNGSQRRVRSPSVSPTRHKPVTDVVNSTFRVKQSTPTITKQIQMERLDNLDISVIPNASGDYLPANNNPPQVNSATIEKPKRTISRTGTITKGKRTPILDMDATVNLDETKTISNPRDRSVSKERPTSRPRQISGLPRPTGLPRLKSGVPRSRLPTRAPKK